MNVDDKNITDYVLESVKEINNKQIELQNKIDESVAMKRSIAREKRHKQRMLAEKAKQDAYVNNNNYDSEALLASQVDYQTTYNDSRDEREEEKQKEETEKRKCLTWLVEQVKDKQKYDR